MQQPTPSRTSLHAKRAGWRRSKLSKAPGHLLSGCTLCLSDPTFFRVIRNSARRRTIAESSLALKCRGASVRRLVSRAQWERQARRTGKRRQQIAYRLDHRLHTHSFRFLQIVEYFSAPTYHSLCPGHPVSQFGQCQLWVIHLWPPQTARLDAPLPPRRFSASTSRPPLRSAGAARQGRASAPPRLQSIAPRIAAGADTLTADRWPARCRPAGLPPGVTAVPAPEALELVSWMLSGLFRRYERKAISRRRAEWSCLSLRCSRRMVPSVEVRPRRSIAPVLKKVSVDLLTIAQPLGLRRREQWLLPVERLSNRHPLFRNGHSHQNSNHRSDFDRGSPRIRHDRLHPWRCESQAPTLGL